jgi:ppGpp synthetase/RelA/SpoT-type nucleotidyltranferase
MRAVAQTVAEHPNLNEDEMPVIHSYKTRLKSEKSIAQKIHRKVAKGQRPCSENFFAMFTDLAGVRVLHLYRDDFRRIHKIVRDKIDTGDWHLGETPKAYIWDPEWRQMYEDLGINVEEKPTSYTSVHYLLKPRLDSKICCELQVRTLFEEIWGEVDHQMIYPSPTSILACKEQILVLSKLVGAGSRLLDSLYRVYRSAGPGGGER